MMINDYGNRLSSLQSLMKYDPSTPELRLEACYINLFNALPGNCILLRNDEPRYTVVAASPSYCALIGFQNENLIGNGLFDLFSSNSNDSNNTGEKRIKASLAQVLQLKISHELPVHQYDTKNEKGSFSERYWRVLNTPVLTDESEVAYIIHSIIEITDQINAGQIQEKLKGLEMVHNLFRQAPVAVCIVKGSDYIVELVNEEMLQFLGRTEAMIGKPIIESLPEAGLQGLISILDDVRSTGAPYFIPNFPAKLLINGILEQRFFNLVFKPFFHDPLANVTTGVFCSAYNVTELVVAKRNVEEAQQEAERQRRLYETINTSTPDLIYVFDLNYRFTYVNKALLDMWGSTWEQSVGKGLLENGYEPWHAQMHEREIDQVVITKERIRGEVSFVHATLGKRIYDYIFVPVLNEKGNVEAVAGTTRDITEIKLAEQAIRESNERFRNLANESPIFVFIIDADPEAPVSYWNKTWLQYTGQTLEEAVGRAWEGIIHPDDVPFVMADYTFAFQNKQAYFIPAARVKRYDGKYRWHAFKGNPRFLANGDFNGYIGVGFDIHEQKLAEEVLKESEVQLQQKVAERTADLERTVEELRRSNQNLEEFAHAASHDLKEPVRKVHVFSNLLKNSFPFLNEEQQRLFERVEDASRRMSALIDDLLDYSHVSMGVDLLEQINLNKKVANVLQDLEIAVQEKGAQITVGNLPVIKGHRRQLQQLFHNLIQNSLKYSKKDTIPQIHIFSEFITGIDFSFDLSGKERNKPFHLIRIKDNGIGFEQDQADKIFQMFKRLHGKSEYEGSGVGLAIVKKVVENHKGYIKAESKPGDGAIFNIFLPVE